jgi:hypothetical protein
MVQLKRDEIRFRDDTFNDLGIGHSREQDQDMGGLDLMMQDNEFADMLSV